MKVGCSMSRMVITYVPKCYYRRCCILVCYKVNWHERSPCQRIHEFLLLP
uniref:Uncharacterized protein n=1 Tax=Rhizophora mucronata TaxID=61149 RepID=A0A2P2NHH8_RHIMU